MWRLYISLLMITRSKLFKVDRGKVIYQSMSLTNQQAIDSLDLFQLDVRYTAYQEIISNKYSDAASCAQAALELGEFSGLTMTGPRSAVETCRASRSAHGPSTTYIRDVYKSPATSTTSNRESTHRLRICFVAYFQTPCPITNIMSFITDVDDMRSGSGEHVLKVSIARDLCGLL